MSAVTHLYIYMYIFHCTFRATDSASGPVHEEKYEHCKHFPHTVHTLTLYMPVHELRLVFNLSLSASPSSSSSSSSSLLEEGGSGESVCREKELQLKASLMGVEVGMCGSDVGQVMSASVTGKHHRPPHHCGHSCTYIHTVYISTH